jgi:hypothetical protein
LSPLQGPRDTGGVEHGQNRSRNEDDSVSYWVKIRLKGRPGLRDLSPDDRRPNLGAAHRGRDAAGASAGRWPEAIDYLEHEVPILAESERRNRVRHLDCWRGKLGERLLSEGRPGRRTRMPRSPHRPQERDRQPLQGRSRLCSPRRSRWSGSSRILYIAVDGSAQRPSARRSATGRSHRRRWRFQDVAQMLR